MEYADEIYHLLRCSIESYYATILANNEDFYNAVMQDIAETSDFSVTGWFSNGDLKLAIGRVILNKFGIKI